MATRSRIGIILKDGSIESIYCHWDGNIEDVGKTLVENYKDTRKVKKLIQLGNLSSLAEKCTKPKGHSFETPVEGYCVAYGRDRGEKNIDSIIHSENSWPKCGQEYEYVFKKGEWYLVTNKGLKTVSSILKEMNKN